MITWLALAGCGGKDTTTTPDTDTADADTDTDTDADSDADSDSDTDSDADADSDADTDSGPTTPTGTTGDTGAPAGRAGTYVGNLHADLADIGFVVNQASCDDPKFTIVVDATGAMTGSGSCTTPAPLAGQTFTVDLTGAITVDPAADGTVTLGWPALPSPETDDWAGSFTGPDTLEGSFSGTWYQGSQAFEWDVTFSVTR